MTVIFGISISLTLIALGIGVSFLVWAHRNQGKGTLVGNIFGYIITIIAGLTLIGTLHSALTDWRAMHHAMMMMHQMQMQQGGMPMQKGMMQHGMPMQQGMGMGKGMHH